MSETQYAVYIDHYGEEHLVRVFPGHVHWYGGRQRRARVALIDDNDNQQGRVRFVATGSISISMTLDGARRFRDALKAEHIDGG